jgi:hypothetical protein
MAYGVSVVKCNSVEVLSGLPFVFKQSGFFTVADLITGPHMISGTEKENPVTFAVFFVKPVRFLFGT